MDNTNSLQLLTTNSLDGIKLDCYKDNSEVNDFWATREQIGRLLGYKHPQKAIKDIHARNRERLDMFSMVIKTPNPTKQDYAVGDKSKRGAQFGLPITTDFSSKQFDGGLTELKNAQLTTLYSFKGLLEICRWSNQPKANEVIDFMWNIADELRLGNIKIYKTAVFNEHEKFLHEQQHVKAMQAIVTQEQEKVRALKNHIADNLAYTTVGRLLTSAKGSLTISEAADLLQQKGIPIGRNTLYKFGRENDLLGKQKNHWNKPTQKGIKKGIVNLELDPMTNEMVLSTRTMITREGLNELAKIFKRDLYPIFALIDEAEEAENQAQEQGQNQAQTHASEAV